MRPTRLCIAILAAGFLVALLPTLGLAKSWPALPVFWGALALTCGVDAVLSPRRRHVSWDLRVPETLYIGEQDTLHIALRFPQRRPVRASLALDFSDDLEPQPLLSCVAGPHAAEVGCPLIPRRRGMAEIECLWIRYRSPLGLWSWQLRQPLARRVPVLPNLLLVRATALRFFADRDFRAGLKIERYRGDGTEFESLKEYLVGDDNRAIDWKASARHRKLLCRQFQAERNHQIVLTVDTGRLMAEQLGQIPKLDHALNAALLLSYVGLASGDRVGLFTFGSRVGPGLDPLAGVASMKTLAQMTSQIDYSDDETNFTLGLTTLAQRIRRRSLVILLTDFVDTVTAELMLENMQRIARRHLVVFVSIRDPLLGRTARGRPASHERLNRAVVAGNLIRDREVVHRRLQRMGIYPLDVEPHRISADLINQYLDIKRRERL